MKVLIFPFLQTPDGWFGNSSALDTMLYSGKMLHHTANTCSATGTGSGSVGHVTGSANNNSASSGLCGPPSAILPTDDLPTLLAKEVDCHDLIMNHLRTFVLFSGPWQVYGLVCQT